MGAVIVDVNPYPAIVDISVVDAVIVVIGANDEIPGAPLLAAIVGTVIAGKLISRPYPAVVSTGYLYAGRLSPSSAVAIVAKSRRNVDQIRVCVSVCDYVTSRVFSIWNIQSKVESKSNRQQEDKLWEGTVKSWSSAKLCRRFGRKS